MGYSERVIGLLAQAGAAEGDLVKVMLGPAEERTGVLMPHHEFSGMDVVVLKLGSGYNIGVRLPEGAQVQVLSKASRKERPPKAQPAADRRKKVGVLGTGGTIASYVDYRTGAVHPALSAEDLVSAVPEMVDVCHIDAKVVFSIFSENMRVEHWQRLAQEVCERFRMGDAGVIVPHGTDTMGYTAAALSFMLDDLPGPVVLVGAQRSSDRPSSDAYANLIAAARFCAEADASGVFVLMHEGTSDTTAAVHLGTRVRKMHTSRRDAFASINASPVARVGFEGKVEMLTACRPRSSRQPKARTGMEGGVCLLSFYPGLSPRAAEAFIRAHKGAVIAGTGLGHVSREMVEVVRSVVRDGIPVVMSSQCLSGRVNLNVYDTGRDLLVAGAIPGEDMLPETALVKLMWALGNSKGQEEVRALMATDLRGEMSQRRES